MNTQNTITLQANITKDHIQHGVKRVCNKCPIALAIQEALPEALKHLRVSVSYDGIRLLPADPSNPTEPNYYAPYVYQASSAKVLAFMVKFDMDKEVELDSYTLEFKANPN